MSDTQKVFLVIGAGGGVGSNVARKFAAEGYHAVLVRRTGFEGLEQTVAEIQDSGGAATGMLLNAVDEDAIENLVETVERDIGPIECVLFNLGAQVGNRALADTSYKTFEMGWRMATFALFRLAHALFPRMEARGHGCLLVTSATAAMRGNAGQHSHAAAIGGRRMLCQSLNAEFASKGIHVAHITIDGAIEAPDTFGKLVGAEAYARILAERGQGKDQLVVPAQLAETYYHIAHQHRSCWSFDVDIRPFTEQPWWNN